MPRRVVFLACLLSMTLSMFGPAQGAQKKVEAQDNKFVPADITISVGDTVTFTNTGQLPHTATLKDGSFDSGNLNSGDSKEFTFKSAGTYDYVCTYHLSLGMKGTITVAEAGTGDAKPVAIEASPVVGATSPSPSGSAKAAEGPPPPPTQKYFPAIAFGMLVLLAIALGVGYMKSASQKAEGK